MKRFFLVTFLLLLMVIAACKKVSGPANGHSVTPNNNLDSLVSISAVINGQKWKTDSVFANFIKYSGNDSLATSLSINASLRNSTDVQSFYFYITNFNGPGTYPINPPYNTATYYVGTTRNFATSGQIVIVSDVAYSLIGTFNFIANTDTVTGGMFNAALP